MVERGADFKLGASLMKDKRDALSVYRDMCRRKITFGLPAEDTLQPLYKETEIAKMQRKIPSDARDRTRLVQELWKREQGKMINGMGVMMGMY